VPDRGLPQPGAFYATRIAPRLPWITSVIREHGEPEPPPVAEAAQEPQGPFDPVAWAQVDTLARTVRLPLPTRRQFYRLRHCRPLRITRISAQDSQLELVYE
jgi:hypothetical protein